MRATSLLACTGLTLCSLFLFSCSQAAKGPEKGTPAFYWNAATETFSAADYTKTLDHLDKLQNIKTNNEFLAKAQPWYLVLSTGMAHGYMDIADKFEMGARANKENPANFRRQTSTYRQFSRQLTLQFIERFQEFAKATEDQVELNFPFPSGTINEPPTYLRIGNGIMPTAADIESIQSAMVKRGVLLSVARATGSGDDTAKAQTLLKGGSYKEPRGEFMLAMASNLHDHAMLYEQKKLDEPERMRLMLTAAVDAIKASKADPVKVKDLNGKIEKAQKSLPKAKS